MEPHIFVIEDDENIRELIRVALESYRYRVSAFESAEDAIKQFPKKKPDLAIFDIMLPGVSGLEAVKALRKHEKFRQLPIILLTAKDSELDKVVGLDCGADDYITKPFSILELAARVRSLLRRSKTAVPQETPAQNTVTLAGITLNESAHEVIRDGKLIELTYKEFELLKLLMNNCQRVVSREELMETVWGYQSLEETRTLDVHIRSLRQKLSDENGSCIKTVRGVGYRFLAEI